MSKKTIRDCLAYWKGTKLVALVSPGYEEPPTREEINAAIDTLNRFYEHAPFGWGEIEHTVNALDEYRHRMGD